MFEEYSIKQNESFFFFFNLGDTLSTQNLSTLSIIFFSRYFCSAATKEALFTTALKKKTDLNIPQDGDSDITNSQIAEGKRPLPQPGHALKASPVLRALLVFCKGRAPRKLLSVPSWEHSSAGSTIAMLSLLFPRMKPRNFVPGQLHEEAVANSCDF